MIEEEEVILVNTNDEVIGTMPKLEAHLQGKLHRAFSIFIFNASKQLLLQQRALNKYHSPGEWTNTCCSHPKPGEETTDATVRRLQEEMGMECKMEPVFSFLYEAEVGDGLIENEYDHVYFGTSDNLPQPNAEEVSAFRYVDMEELKADLIEHPENYTAWLKISFEQVLFHYYKMFDKEF
ncbi:isopentenyl-diphosphate Delta-isomerase [Pedobacter sp. FW305-3-2-15-E-R2A2]|uniref:isopentenyl-diphosphate Delta-isomerase n=1 Tax=Pedobacter sp. FW305-3-2-15-E-R2A2 TaxID=3140251 RepID=UPI003140BA71